MPENDWGKLDQFGFTEGRKDRKGLNAQRLQ